MFDIETSREMKKFLNPYMNSLPRFNSVVTDLSDNILLLNGDIYCIRNEKIIFELQVWRITFTIGTIFGQLMKNLYQYMKVCYDNHIRACNSFTITEIEYKSK
ncbi:hypothetical protein MXB_1565, partial [Myxobolus squamalis]